MKRETVADTIVYVGSHYEALVEEQDIPEDLDDDCDVDIVDIMQVVSRWGTSCANPDPDSNPDTNNYDPLYDLDGDCDIDIADIMQVAAHWREACERPTETVKYYVLGGKRVAMRKGEELYYLFSDHLGSTNVVYDTSNDTWTTQRYYPHGETRSGESPTDRLFTGQRFDGTIGLYDYGARFYDPALGRFISADPIVPEPGNPQALNRYSYVLNNPLRYIDPSGHDLMIVGGYNNRNWIYPTEWKEWIMTYKGWTTEERWSKFLGDWWKADDAGRQRIMQETGVHIFNWAGFAAGVDPQAASRSAKVEDMLAELSRQMAGMKDITLIGHSKGGNLVLNYVQKMAEGGYMQPKNAVLVDALLQPELIPLVGGMPPEKGLLGHPTVARSAAKVANLYNPLDPVNDFSAGTVWGAENILALSLDVHSTKTPWANSVLNDRLQVQFDHGASRWPYLPVIMK